MEFCELIIAGIIWVIDIAVWLLYSLPFDESVDVVDTLFKTPQQEYSFWWAIGIGMIVSLDVMGLNLSNIDMNKNPSQPKESKSRVTEFLFTIVFFPIVITKFFLLGLKLLGLKFFIRRILRCNFESKSNNGQEINHIPAYVHAGMHACLFLWYMLLIEAFIRIAGGAFNLLIESGLFEVMRVILESTQFTLPEFDIKTLKKQVFISFKMLVGFFVIIFVWKTYLGKINENHKEKEDGNIENVLSQRSDVQLIYRHFIKKLKTSREKGLALTVAVDMLAISALIRVYFKGFSDSNYPEPHFKFTSIKGADYDVVIFSIIIFITVLFFAYISQKLAGYEKFKSWGKVASFTIQGVDLTRKQFWILTTLRVVETLAVFVILSYAISHLIKAPDDLASYPIGYASVIMGLGLFVSLVSYHSLKEILTKIKIGDQDGANNTTSLAAPLDQGQCAKDDVEISKQRWFLILLIFMGVGFISMVAFIVAHIMNPTSPLKNFSVFLSYIVGVLVFVILFSPIKFLGKKENKWNVYLSKEGQIKDEKGKTKYNEDVRLLWYIGLIYYSVIFFVHSLFTWVEFKNGCSLCGIFSSVEPFVYGLCIFGLYFIVCLFWLYLRARRQADHTEKSFLTVSEILTAFGMVGFMWSLILIF